MRTFHRTSASWPLATVMSIASPKNPFAFSTSAATCSFVSPSNSQSRIELRLGGIFCCHSRIEFFTRSIIVLSMTSSALGTKGLSATTARPMGSRSSK